MRPLASYATLKLRGPLYAENIIYVNGLNMDLYKLTKSTAFRRLEYKTQVFANYEGDHFRTRLTHSLEVAQIARILAVKLNISEHLTEVIALGHDIGHPPFGHSGEEALNTVMKDYGGFDHNVHTIKMVTLLESKYKDYEGLNLSWEVLEGLIKHNGPIAKPHEHIKYINNLFNFMLNKQASLEAQCASIADDIAYNVHDVEDGLSAGLITKEQLKNLEIFKKVSPDLDNIYEATRKLSFFLVQDVIDQTLDNITNNDIYSIDDIRNAKEPTADMTKDTWRMIKELKEFLRENLYFHEKVLKVREVGENIIKQLFSWYFEDIARIPKDWREKIEDDTGYHKAQVISDFIAGMTDRFATKEFEKIN